MIGTRKTESTYLIKDLPFTRILAGEICVVSGAGLLMWNLSGYVLNTSVNATQIGVVFGLVSLGLFILYRSRTTVSIFNRELRVLTICTKSYFTTSYSQYGYDAIGAGLEVEKEDFIGQLFSTFRINLHLNTENVYISGRVLLYTDELIKAVSEAKDYLSYPLDAKPASDI